MDSSAATIGKNRIESIRNELTKYPLGFMLFIFLSLAIPRIYHMTNTFWVGHIDYSSLAIAEQYEFMGILIEIVNESIPYGVLALVSQNYRKRENIIEQLKVGVILQLGLSFLMTVIIIFNMSNFVNLIGTEASLVAQTKSYLSIRALALPFESLGMLLVLGLKSMNRPKIALFSVFLFVVINMIFDILLVSNLPVSLQWGVQGVAWGFPISNVFFFMISLFFTLRTLKVTERDRSISTLGDTTFHLFRIGGWTGLDSLVRNAFYFITLQILNYLGSNQYAGFQLFQMIMWTVLIPVIALSQGTSIRVGNYLGEDHSKRKILNVLVISSAIAFSIVTSFGLIGLFMINNIGNIFTNNLEVIGYSSTMFFWQIIPYILFAVSMNLRSIFYGTGKTLNILLISLILNLGIILPFYILMNNNILLKNYTSIMIMFVFIDVVDILVTIKLAQKAYRQISSKI